MQPREQSVRTLTVTTLRADVDRVKAFVAYHRHLGVDEMMLFFDDPDDPAIMEVQNQPGVNAVACDDEYWWALQGRRPAHVQARQVANVNSVLDSRGDEFDWLIHIDSDELVHAPFGLAQTLQREGAGVSVLQMSVFEAIPPSLDDHDPFRSTALFRRHRPNLEMRARRRGAATGFQGSHFLRGHTQGKPAVHLNGVVRRMRIHRAAEFDEERFTRRFATDLHVLHYDSGTFHEWCDKWRNRDRFSKAGHRESRMGQWEEFARLDALGDGAGLRALYETNFMLPAHEIPVLQEIGLVERVELDATWFDWPP